MAIKLDKDDLEKSLSRPDMTISSLGVPGETAKIAEMTHEGEIGFHKGSLNTLAAERNELVKMIGNVEAIMQAHLKRLEELGVKIEMQKGDK